MLEVCIDSLESAWNAIQGGADELEVCSSLTEGGLTPSIGLVKEIITMVQKLDGQSTQTEKARTSRKPKVNVMLRCRTGSDFNYSHFEMSTMLADLEAFKALNVDRFVFGALNNKQDVDSEVCYKVIEMASPIPVTFHRAFDLCKNPTESIETLIDLGFNRVLTSGQKSSAADENAFILIQSLVNRYGDKIEVMPGAGVTATNAKLFIDIGCKIVHSSCKVMKKLPVLKYGLSMGTNDSESIIVTDEKNVRQLKAVISN